LIPCEQVRRRQRGSGYTSCAEALQKFPAPDEATPAGTKIFFRQFSRLRV